MAKKHGHEKKHAHCEHCLHACTHCEVAYCCDCNKEWGACRLSHYYPWWDTRPIPTTTIWDSTTDYPGTTWRSGATTDITLTNETHSHAHTN